MEFRSAEGRVDRAGEAAAEFARMRVAVIVMGGDSEVLAAKRAWAIQSATVWWRAWRGQEATSQAWP